MTNCDSESVADTDAKFGTDDECGMGSHLLKTTGPCVERHSAIRVLSTRGADHAVEDDRCSLTGGRSYLQVATNQEGTICHRNSISG